VVSIGRFETILSENGFKAHRNEFSDFWLYFFDNKAARTFSVWFTRRSGYLYLTSPKLYTYDEIIDMSEEQVENTAQELKLLATFGQWDE
jgi:hypothetical protein